jgi:hypothetical protein
VLLFISLLASSVKQQGDFGELFQEKKAFYEAENVAILKTII